jgi:hypothetical protein
MIVEAPAPPAPAPAREGRAEVAARPRSRSRDAVALAVLAAVVALVAWNRLTFDVWLTRLDLYTFFLPWYTFLGERVRALAVPGWNPHLFSGAPFAGDPESGWMYAPAMLTFALFSTISAFKAMVVVQLAVAAVSTYAFGRVLGMGVVGALGAAVVYVTGPFLHWNTHCCLVFAQFATWVPLALLGIELTLRAVTWRERIVPWFLAGFAISQMLAGWIGEGWLYAMLLPAAYIGYRALLSPPRPRRDVRRRLLLMFATGTAVLGLGLALGAAGVLPRLAINPETNLAGGNYAALGDEGMLNPPWALEYLLTQTLGRGSGYHFRAAAIGGVAIVLSLLAIFIVRRRFAVPFFAVLTLIAMILTLDWTPLHELFYLIPRYRDFHDHDAWRTIALTAIGPAMLSGATLASLPSWRGRRGLLPLVFTPLLLLVFVDLLLRQRATPLGWQPLLAAALTTLLVALVVALPVSTPRFGRPDRLATLVPVLLIALAFLLPAGLELTGSWWGWPRDEGWERRWTANPVAAEALAEEVRATDPGGAGAFLQEQLAASGPFRYVGYGGAMFPGDSERESNYMERRTTPEVQAILVNGRPIYLGLYEIQGYNPLHLARYDEFLAAINGATQNYHTAYLLPSGTGSPLLDLLQVRYVVLDASLPRQREDVVALTAGARRVFRSPSAHVYERAGDLPHAWIVYDVRSVARGEALPLLTSGAIDPYQTALVEGTAPETAAPETAAPATSGSASARVLAYEPDRITLAANATAPGLLVISEVYAPGWRAFVNGREAPVLPTDHALRGVPLPAGEHTVELRYEPLSLRVGLIITGLALATLAIALLAAAWRRIAAGYATPSSS